MSTEPQYLTNEKFAELKKEFEYLRTERRKEVADHLEYAKKLGDLSENAEYHQAREEQAEVEDRIGRLETIIKTAHIVGAGGGDTISIGSRVSVRKDDADKLAEYLIVGSEEADMAQSKISNLSPLGSALVGHKVGETVKVATPKGTASYVIKAIK